MKKFRIGNDVPITWTILTNHERISLAGRDLQVTCTDAYGAAVTIEYNINGADINITIPGRNQKTTGTLTLLLIENEGKQDQRVVDAMAVELVPHSWQAECCKGETVLMTSGIETTLSVQEIERFRTIAAQIPDVMTAATAANNAAAEQLSKGMFRYNNDWWNMNCCLQPGVYEGCHAGRPAGSSEGEFYVCYVTVAKRADQNDGVDVLSQVAVSSSNAQRIFTRKILTRDRSVYEPPTTVYEDWKAVGADDKAELTRAINAKLAAAAIGIGGSGLKKESNGNVMADVYAAAASDIFETQAGQTFDTQLINVYMLRLVLAYFAKSQNVYTKTESDEKETALSTRITNLSNALDRLIGIDNVTAAIDSFYEVIAFLNGISDTTLDSLLTTIRSSVATEQERAMTAEATKQDAIEDLATIRSGAAAGATAYQKPQTGIPASELAAAVQASLSKAETALQDHQDLSGLITELNNLGRRINALEFNHYEYYAEAYTPETTDVTPVKSYGDKTLLKRFDFYLLDTTDNSGTTTTPVGRLERNNLLRFADGGAWAPVVGITQAQAADALEELFIKENGSYVQYCAAGEYDADAYVRNVLRKHYNGTLTYDGPELYKSDGNGGYVEAHALCPWETTETKYTIGLAADRKLYILDNVAGNSGYIWKGIFSGITSWDGIDLTPYALEKTAIAPCPVCTIDDNGTHKTRNFFYLYQGDTNCQGAKGADNVFDMFAPGNRTYPRTSDISQVANMNMARANNANAESPLPFAEGGYFALDAFIIAQELLYSRRNPFRAAQFGSGISSNDTCNSETTWRTNGGVRYKKDDEDSPSFCDLSTRTPFYYNSSAKRTNFTETLNGNAPKEQCMESQIVASFITEFGLPATTDVTAPNYFIIYGGKYYYMNIDDVEGLEDGYMNVKVYRELEAEGTIWYDAEGNAVTYDIAVVLRMSLMAGANLSGDIHAYWGGGCEVVGTCGENTANGTAGHRLDYYLQPDQSHWLRVTDYTQNNLGLFDFESVYPHLGYSDNMENGYALQRMAYLPKRSKAGGSIARGECYYSYEEKNWTKKENQRVRIGLRFRGYAYYGYCSPRFWTANYSASYTSRTYGGSAQARIN